MAERYRSKLRSGREAISPTFLKQTNPLDEERGRILLEMVQRLLNDERPAPVEIERRRALRRPYPSLILLTPCTVTRQPILDGATTVVAKDLTPLSVGFVHTRAPREKQVMLTFQQAAGEPLALIAEIRRVTALRQGLYLIGAEFVSRWAVGVDYDEPVRPS